MYPDSEGNYQDHAGNAYEPKIEMETSNGDIDPRFHPRVEIEEDDDGMDDEEEDDEGTSCDVASFAQVTYANLDQPKTEEPAGNSELNPNKGGKENYCTMCQHSFTNKYSSLRYSNFGHVRVDGKSFSDFRPYRFIG